ncbi:hypothetical protein EVAR_61806_1 [Eumeta japonica]|uniref:Uncharacterized protein n=1 Tax=Eumeta variegata TaxID=151549 RepID=A0A4C1YWR8_EUMVA|nr:hypothetical protein EVAR_61806_1 [Eumeta japonica]
MRADAVIVPNAKFKTLSPQRRIYPKLETLRVSKSTRLPRKKLAAQVWPVAATRYSSARDSLLVFATGHSRRRLSRCSVPRRALNH